MGSWLQIAILGLSLSQQQPLPPRGTELRRPAMASYVPVCKNRRGLPDRRACGGRSDPRRSLMV